MKGAAEAMESWSLRAPRSEGVTPKEDRVT
ncbi:uncharacterized protein G2W53_021713 [Senna tora]|uniref:Uncharacterized protein n=1 Tax=Senna tora TaxID=362788 RepID=A0A834TLT5_9FABA|nr:uncharacterized protein G2W53_021713 [Senna tora]